MIKQLLSLASIFFVLICVGAVIAHFVDMPSIWEYLEQFYHIFDNEGTLEVQSTPAGAAVYIDNAFVGQTPLTRQLADGAYDIKVIHEGYQTFARRIAIEKKETAELRAKLSKEYGSLHITSTPSNAIVFLDGARQGQLTPLEIKVSPGRYYVKVVKDKFYTYDEEVFVNQGKTMTIDANLVRQVGRIVLETIPAGAEAYIGGDLIGTTPLTQDKPVGTYVITIKKKGFREKVIEAVIAPDETLKINEEMIEKSGALKITTSPPGAEVHINDAYQGETPLRIELKPGAYQIVIQKQSHRALSEEIVVEDNTTKNIHRDLDPAIGEFRIDSDPPHAKVWIDSENIGFTPITVNKLPGIYTVRITKPGYKNYVEEIHVKEGAFIQLKPVLEKDSSGAN